ncbi:hypothetical protein JB92DRAFT_3136061 [Gautieria morchelliformis]|nr:hypothetical protein JB92DRAFT_3136061 [Gautieria morchelliformis]
MDEVRSSLTSCLGPARGPTRHELWELVSTGAAGSHQRASGPHIVRRSEQANTGRQPKMKLTGFDLVFQSMIHLSCRYYPVIFGPNDPFPLEQDMDRFLWEAWQIACIEYDVKLGPTPEVFTLIKQRGSQIRGEVKRNARPLITVHYKFDASEDTA